MTKSIQTVTWEFAQNLPLITGFMLALRYWQQGQALVAIICAVISSIVGSLIIRLTEANIVDKPREPLSVTMTNMVIMSLLMLIIILYLTAPWSNWKIDFIVGGLAGVVLASAQNLAAKKRIGIGHMMAFALAFPLTLISIRMLTGILPIVGTILLLTLFITVIISLIDYGFWSTHK